MALHIIYFLAGLALLIVGSELLIRGSLAVAKRFGISPLLSGLLIVGFGTSTPELVVSLNAAINGQADIAIGNVVGSNIGNILLILGLCALISPLNVNITAIKRDAVMVIVASALFIGLVVDGHLGRANGALLLAVLLCYLGWAYWSEKYRVAPSAKLHKAEAKELAHIPKSALLTTVATLGGLSLLLVGSHAFLLGVTSIANHFGVPESVTGLTVVAVGTSLPELSISLIAAIRRHADVAVGNVLGSNIFNVLGILGISSIVSPLPISLRVVQFDQWVMLLVSALLLYFLYSRRQLSRIEALLLLAGYVGYVWLSFTIFAN
ncbi:calcium/sodium antiporter [Thalassotalea sp. LPB0316]|uniref:calcium/sodium antiporter n=1 Tax=Thalassotalea sp. LPB0316 TaxID=2769490 RepID=UPI001865DF36|nr:calcium/sodium antiporter [Thalassotalea sp. LPB0316]QOL24696.1 calcium/sodium antiporter [Thalassotalea sp. LPB0316]